MVADLESFRGIHLNQGTPARRFTHVAHPTRVVRVPDFDYLVFPLKKQYDFDNGVTDIAGLNAAFYRGPLIPELDKIKQAVEEDKPLDDAGEVSQLCWRRIYLAYHTTPRRSRKDIVI